MYQKPQYLFIAALIIALAGFFPTYFSRLGEAPTRHHIHGILSTAWLVLLIVQGWLISHREFKWHRLLGRLSLPLAVAVFVAAAWLVSSTVTEALERRPDLFSKVYFMDTIMVPFFGIIYGCGIVFRHHVQIHQRCMVLTLLPLLPPALGRAIFFYALYPLGFGFPVMWHPMMVIVIGLLAFGIYDDHRRGQIYWPYPVGFVLASLIYITAFFTPESEMIQGLLNWIAI